MHYAGASKEETKTLTSIKTLSRCLTLTFRLNGRIRENEQPAFRSSTEGRKQRNQPALRLKSCHITLLLYSTAESETTGNQHNAESIEGEKHDTDHRTDSKLRPRSAPQFIQWQIQKPSATCTMPRNRRKEARNCPSLRLEAAALLQPSHPAVDTVTISYAEASKKLSSIFSTAPTSYLTYLERFFVKLSVLYLL